MPCCFPRCQLCKPHPQRHSIKITKSIEKKSKSSSNDVEAWVTSEINQLDWDKDLDKSKDRKKIREKLIKKGIKKFK